MVRDVPVHLRGTSPGPDEWSVHQIVEHLVMAEEAVLAGVDDPARLKPRARSLKARFLYRVVMAVLRSPIPVKVPSRSMLPTGDRELETLIGDWEASHERLRELAAAADAGQVRGAIFRHPVAGPVDTPSALRMLEVHLRRHEGQLRTTVRKLEGL